jgi:histidinol phosphatase-like enzyme (inositol monophosphatase family)
MIESFIPFARELAAIAAAQTLPRFRAGVTAEHKGGERFDPVTLADREAEAALRRRIEAAYPDHGIVGEEYGDDRSDADFVWVLDPVDGTRAFIAGLPVWTTLIGLSHQGRPVLGVIAQPCLGEVYIGGPGMGSCVHHLGDVTPLRTRPCPELSAAILHTTDPALLSEAEWVAWQRLAASARLARLGCDAYAMAMVAAGRIDLVVECGLKRWDIDGPAAVIMGAGGTVRRGVGAGGRTDLLAGDAAMIDAALGVFA